MSARVALPALMIAILPVMWQKLPSSPYNSMAIERNDMEEWISPTDEETEQSAKRILLAAHAELKEINDDSTLKRAVHDILRAFAAAKNQEKLDMQELKKKYKPKNVYSFCHSIPHIVASAINSQGCIEGTHPYSVGGLPIWAYAEAVGLLKQYNNFNDYIDFINDDVEFYSDKIESVANLVLGKDTTKRSPTQRKD